MHVYCNIVQGRPSTIIGFAIWPDLPKTQSLNHANKARPTVHVQHNQAQSSYDTQTQRQRHTFLHH